jgi:hypothetical protein
MKKIFITSSEYIINHLERNLRYKFDIDFKYSNRTEGKIEARKNNEWVTICRFSSDENLDDILTMFNVNYEIKCR